MDKFDANKLIQERAMSRGSFLVVANTAQELKRFSRTIAHTTPFERAEQEAIDNICTKIARIVNRKSLYDLDSWQDIAGYATLVVNLIKEQEAQNEAE